MSDLLPENPPTPENGYTVDATMELTAALFNFILSSIHSRLTAREELEATFEGLVEAGTSAGLTMIQENIAPQIVLLRQAIDDALAELAIINEGVAPNSILFNSKPASFYLDPANFAASEDILALLAASDAASARAVLGVTAAISAAIESLLGEAPEALDTLRELADALGSDPNFATTVTNALAAKATKTELDELRGHLPSIGSYLWMARDDAAPAGHLRCDGSSFDEATYPALYAYLGTNVLPNVANRVLRMVGPDTPAVGAAQEDAMQRIHGEMMGTTGNGLDVIGFINSTTLTSPASGAFKMGPTVSSSSGFSSGSSSNRNSIAFDSGDSPGARVSDDETRVKAVIAVCYIKAYDSVGNRGDADLIAMEQRIQRALVIDPQALTEPQKAQIHANLDTAAEVGKLALGYDQTWQNVSGSRVAGTSYQNTTGKPIQVCIIVANGTHHIETSDDGVSWERVVEGPGSGRIAGLLVIPPGHYYRAVTGFYSWSELQ